MAEPLQDDGPWCYAGPHRDHEPGTVGEWWGRRDLASMMQHALWAAGEWATFVIKGWPTPDVDSEATRDGLTGQQWPTIPLGQEPYFAWLYRCQAAELPPLPPKDILPPPEKPSRFVPETPTKFTPEETAVVMEGVDGGCDACDNELGEVMLRLITSLEPVIVEHDKEIVRLRKKITRLINRQQSECANLLEKIATNIGNVYVNEAYTLQLTLGDLQEKLAKIPKPEAEKDASSVTQFKVDVKPIVDALMCICEVLKEVRDRLPGVPHEEVGDLPDVDLPDEPALTDVVVDAPQELQWTGEREDVAAEWQGEHYEVA